MIYRKCCSFTYLLVYLCHWLMVTTMGNNYDYILQAGPINFIQHPESVSTTLGSEVFFVCVSNLTAGSLRPYPGNTPKLFWRFNGKSPLFDTVPHSYPSHWNVSSTDNSSQLFISSMSESDIGYYECMIGDGLRTEGNFAAITVTKRAWLSISGNTSRKSSNVACPLVDQTSREIWAVNGLLKTVKFPCTTSEPNTTLYWYKDGENITHFRDPSTGILTYGESNKHLYGIYQCFIENSAGSNYINIRVLPDNFANPPTNLSCYVVENVTRRRIVMTWQPPTLLVSYFKTIRYQVQINGSLHQYVTSDLHYEMDVTGDGVFLCEVFVINPFRFAKNNGSVAKTSTRMLLEVLNVVNGTDSPFKVQYIPMNSAEGDPSPSTVAHNVIAKWVVLTTIALVVLACGLTFFFIWVFFDCRRRRQVRNRYSSVDMNSSCGYSGNFGV